MTPQQQQVLEILARVVGRPVADLKPEQDLKSDLDLDSAQAMELMADIEETFDREISEVEAAKVTTVADLLAFAPGD